MQLISIARPCHKLGQFRAHDSPGIHETCMYRSCEVGTMRGFHNRSFDPQTLIVLGAAFDEAWVTLNSIGNTTVKPDELARSVLRLAMEGDRDPVALQLGALHEQDL